MQFGWEKQELFTYVLWRNFLRSDTW